MAHNSTDNPTLRDIAESASKAGQADTSVLIKRVTDNTDFLSDVVFVPGNDGSNHKTREITSLPEAVFVDLYDGPKPSKGGGKTHLDSCGMCKSLMEVDADIVKKQGSEEAQKQYLSREKNQHAIAVANAVARVLFYGNHKQTPEEFNGLFQRLRACGYNITTNVMDEFNESYTVINGGKANSTKTDLRSLALVNWNVAGVHGFYHGGGGFPAGISESVPDTAMVTAPSGGRFLAITQMLSMSCGLSIADTRMCGRLANLSLSELNTATKDECIKYVELIRMLMSRVTTQGSGKVVWYADKNTKAEIDMVFSRADCLNGVSAVKNAYGEMEDMIFKFPVREVPALNVNEARIS